MAEMKETISQKIHSKIAEHVGKMLNKMLKITEIDKQKQ